MQLPIFLLGQFEPLLFHLIDLLLRSNCLLGQDKIVFQHVLLLPPPLHTRVFYLRSFLERKQEEVRSVGCRFVLLPGEAPAFTVVFKNRPLPHPIIKKLNKDIFLFSSAVTTDPWWTPVSSATPNHCIEQFMMKSLYSSATPLLLKPGWFCLLKHSHRLTHTQALKHWHWLLDLSLLQLLYTITNEIPRLFHW